MRPHDVLIIGAGSIGERHLRCFQATGRASVRLAELDPELRREVAGRYGVSRTHGDIAEALGDPPGVAVVATPTPSHVPVATAMAEAGVHVLVEKPLGTSLEGVDRLCEAVARRGVVAGVAYVYRVNPLLRALHRAIADGRFGRPVELLAACGQHFPTYRPAFRSTYYRDHATGGGAIQDALTHLLNAGEWILGPIDRLVADAARQVLDGVSVEDTAHVLARHGDALASYSLNQHQAPNEFTLTVACERGTARVELHEHRWRWMTEPGNAWHDEPIAPLQRDALFTAQAGLFLDAVEGGPPPPCSIAEGLQTLRVNLAALSSVGARAWREVGR